MSCSRTPILDARLANPMTAEEAYRAADALFKENPRLRTPALDRRIAGARDEFADPDYVDAILRNMAALPIRSAYSPRRLPALAGPCADACPDTLAEVAEGIVALNRKLDGTLSENGASHVPEQILDDLENRVAAFLEPFYEIFERGGDVFEDFMHGDAAACPDAGSYRKLAKELGLPSTAVTCLLLRYSSMPSIRYLQGVRRLGYNFPRSAVRRGWLLATLLDNPYSDDPTARAAVLSRMARVVFIPLMLAGRQAGVISPARAVQAPTLF